MGVYIRGMEMPKSCNSCPIRNGVFCPVKRRLAELNEMPKWCPLIEIPTPHGRLIDADALIADLKRQCKEVFRIDAVSPDDFWITRNEAYNERLWTTWCESLGDYINAAPTIIEAEPCAEPCNDLSKPNIEADCPPSTPLKQVWEELFGEDGDEKKNEKNN